MATCPTCGSVLLAPDDIVITVFPPPELARNYYVFRCPKCADEIRKNATPHVTGLLLMGKVRVVQVHPDALVVHEGPPITVDDILALHEQLEALDHGA